MLGVEGPELRKLREADPRTSLTITPSFAARYKSNVYDTRRGRIGDFYVEPSLLAFMRTPLDEAGCSGFALGGYVDQQVFSGLAAREAGYTLLRAIAQYDFALGPWEIGVRYAPSITFDGDSRTKDYLAHDLRVSLARDYDPSAALGLSTNQLRLEPRVVFAPPDANYSLGAALGIGKRFSNDPAPRRAYWKVGGGGVARVTFNWRFEWRSPLRAKSAHDRGVDTAAVSTENRQSSWMVLRKRWSQDCHGVHVPRAPRACRGARSWSVLPRLRLARR